MILRGAFGGEANDQEKLLRNGFIDWSIEFFSGLATNNSSSQGRDLPISLYIERIRENIVFFERQCMWIAPTRRPQFELIASALLQDDSALQ
jgi:hypothetical protein